MKIKGGMFQSFLAAFFAGGCNVLLIMCPVPNYIKFLLTYLVIVFIELCIAFPAQRISTYIKAFGGMYLLSFAFGGVLEWICEKFLWANRYGRTILWFLSGIYFISLCIERVCKRIQLERLEKENLRWVCCEVNGKTISCIGLWDTGNELYDPLSKGPVLVLERNELIKNSICIKKEQYRIIPYHSIGTRQGVLEAFLADRVVVSGMEGDEFVDGIERKKVLIGIYEGKLCQDERYHMILHPKM